jgi:dTDP-4-dehydrorhamnose 3,5-epimerase
VSERFEVVDTPIEHLQVVLRKPRGDSRGYLERLFCTAELQPLIGGRSIAQINHTLTTRRGTVRGLHFQLPPHAEMKIISCLRGEVYDVAVDLRRNSATFLRWHAEVLSATNCRSLVIPEGFAHGFQTLTDDCEMLYFHTAAFQPEAESGLNSCDPLLAIRWPEAVTELSQRDSSHPMLTQHFRGMDS